MPKVPLYQATEGTGGIAGSAPMVKPSGTSQGLGNISKSLGGVGDTFAKLQEQRNTRNDYIEAINLFTELDGEVRKITTEGLKAQGSDAFGLYDRNEDLLKKLNEEFEKRPTNDRVRQVFKEHVYHSFNASRNQIAAHQAAQEKVARDQAIENLGDTYATQINDMPGDEAVLTRALEDIGNNIDMQYDAGKAVEVKRNAEIKLKSEYVRSLGRVNAKAALETLEKWQESGTFDAKTFDGLKGELARANDKQVIDAADVALRTKFKGNYWGMASEVMRNREKYGLSISQASALQNIYEGQINFMESQKKAARDQAAQGDLSNIVKLMNEARTDPEKLQEALNLAAFSPNLDSEQRALVNRSIERIEAVNDHNKSVSIISDILQGKYRNAVEVQLATFGMKSDAANNIQEIFSKMQTEDRQAYSQAVEMYKSQMKDTKGSTLKFASPASYFESELVRICTNENLHGMEIVKRANELIGYYETTGKNKAVSPWKDMEKQGLVGPTLNSRNIKKTQRPSNTATVKINRKGANLLAGYDKGDVEIIRKALEAKYPGRTITDEDVKKGLDMNLRK